MTPRVSVIITTWNNPAVLRRSMGSVKAQTFRDWELIIVYDGAADAGTKRIVADFAARDPRIRPLIEAPHTGGPARPRNIGSKHARGEFLAILDDDDEWLPAKLEKQLAVFSAEGARRLILVMCNFLNVYEDGSIKEQGMPRDHIRERMLLADFNPLPSTYLIRKALLEETGGWNEELPAFGGGGIDINLRMIARYDFGFVYEPLVRRFLLPARLSKVAATSRKRRQEKLWELYRTYELNDALYRAHPTIAARVWRDLGARYAILIGDTEKARECFRRAVSFHSGSWRPRLDLLLLSLGLPLFRATHHVKGRRMESGS